MPEWIRRLRQNWPVDSKDRALGGKSAVQALNEALRKPKTPIEQLNDEDLALALADHIFNQMKRMGVEPAAGKSDRRTDPNLSSDEGHICHEDKNNGDV